MEKLTLELVARVARLSPAYLSRVFKDETGYNFTDYLNITRVEACKKLLSDVRVKLSEIPGLTGFEDQSYFSKVFKRHTGSTPLNYRRTRQITV
jgi:YesN/AraC family two-component response regulator